MNALTGTPAPQIDNAFPSKSQLCGIGYSRGTLKDFHVAICRWLRASDRPKNTTIGYVNPHVFTLAMKNEAIRTHLDQANIVTVDGGGVSIAVWLLNHERVTRTVMTPLFDSVLSEPNLPKMRAVVVGGSEQVSRDGATAIQRACPQMEVTGCIDGYKPMQTHLDFLRAHEDVDVILVAMGSPRSEEFILQGNALFPEKLFWHIGGGTLNYYAGALRRVPKIISLLWLQWLWRIVFEPKIFSRYAIGIPVFARDVFLNRNKQIRK